MIMMIRVVIRAAVNIKKGEHISINYSDPMWGTCNRQIHLGERRDVDHADIRGGVGGGGEVSEVGCTDE